MAEQNTNLATQQEQKPATANKVTDFSLGIFGTSDNFIMANQMAKALANSTMVPKEYQGNVSNALVAMEMAVRVGTSPLIVMQNLDVIYGRPSWRAQYIIAMINGSGKYDMELQYDEKTDKNGKPFSCQCWTTKNGRRVDGPVIDMDLAKAEGWYEKNGSKWKTMPQVMLRYRAAAFFGRFNCPELIMGLYSRDEVIEMGAQRDIEVEAEVFDPFEAKAEAVKKEAEKPQETVEMADGEQATLDLNGEKA